jgi:hypothetical protein
VLTTFEATYKVRKQEIEDFIGMMKFLEEKELFKNEDGVSEFDAFFHNGEGIQLAYQSFINILK